MRSARASVVLAVVLALAACTAGGDPADPATGGPDEGEVVEVPGVALVGDSAAISPVGSRLVVPCDGQLCVWMSDDGAFVGRWEGGSVVAWSNRADVVATDRVDGETVRLVLVDAESGEERDSVEAYSADVVEDGTGAGFADVAFAPDAESVAAVGGDGVVRLWSASDLGEDLELATTDAVALAFSPDASRVAVASSSGPVGIYETGTGAQVGELDGPPQGAVAWSRDGAAIATASFALDDAAATTIWDADTLEVEATLPRAAYRLTFMPASDALVMSEKEQTDVVVWDWADDDVRTLGGATDVPRAVLVAPNGTRIYAVSPRDGVLSWDAAGGEATTFEKPGE